MGLKLRKSIKMGPVRVNLSKSGVGYSVGGKGFRVTKKAGGGTRTTASIPGTGISYTSDSSQKKSSSKSSSRTKSSSYSKTYTSANNSSKSQTTRTKSGGCLTGCLWFFAICLVIGLMRDYWAIILVLALIAVAAFIAFKTYTKKNTEATPETISDSGFSPNPVPDQKKAIEPAKSELDTNRALQFETALQSIPRVNIPLCDPAPRHLLKDMPQYSFSNITRSTRTDSIFPLVVLDTETTGLYPSKHEVIEVSAIKFDSGMIPIACFTTLCKPRNPIPAEASAINHITDERVADAPAFRQIAPALTAFLGGCNVAGHNLDFDLRFVYANGVDLPTGKRFYDTLDLAQLTIPKGYVHNYKLETLCSYYGINRNNAHRSLSDCYATSKIFTRLVFDKTSRQLEADTDIVSDSDTE